MAEWHDGYGKATEHTHDTLDELGVPRLSEDGAALYIHQRISAYGDKRAREAVPEGWKLVPVEPTEEMLTAAHEADREYTLRTFGDVMTVQQGPYDHYVAMLRASPSPDMLEKRNDVA